MLKILFFDAFFLVINLYLLIPAFTKQNFNQTAELVIPTGTPVTETKAEIETQPVKAELKISMCSI